MEMGFILFLCPKAEFATLGLRYLQCDITHAGDMATHLPLTLLRTHNYHWPQVMVSLCKCVGVYEQLYMPVLGVT